MDSRGSRQQMRTTSTPGDNEYKIRADKVKVEGWTYKEDPPETKRCRFCNKTLYHYGFSLPFGGREKEVFKWIEEPERCDCEKAAAYWKQVEIEEAAARAEEERKKEAERLQKKINKLIKDSGIRGRFLTRTFENFETDELNVRAYEIAVRYADAFSALLPTRNRETGRTDPPAKERNGLMIIGSYGTGKTHLAVAIANKLIAKGTPVICMTMIDLLARIKQTFDKHDEATEAEIMRIYEEVPLLVIDDIGSEQPTDWGSTKIFAIVNARYEAYMPTIVTTNYAGDELIRRMTPTLNGRPLDSRNAEKTLDRLKEMCIGIEMNWESWRSR